MQFIATYTSESQQYHHAHPLTPHHHPHQANEVHDMPTMPLSDDMIQLLQKIEPCVNRKFGGRTISVEQFILQRTQQFLKAHTNANKEENKHSRPILTHLELIYLFYGFMQQSPDVLQKVSAISFVTMYVCLCLYILCSHLSVSLFLLSYVVS